MKLATWIGLLLTMSLSGCAAWHGATDAKGGNPSRNTAGDFFSSARESLQKITKKVDHPEPAPWDWATGIPRDVPRGSRVPPLVPADALAHFIPEHALSQVQMVSTHAGRPSVPLTEVAGAGIKDFNALHAAVEQALQSEQGVSIAVGRSGSPPAARVAPATLRAIEHSMLPPRAVVSVSENANPWVIVKEDGVRCKLMVRAERRTGLIHLVTALCVCWGNAQPLPGEIVLSLEGQPVPCLTVADALEVLYDEQRDGTPTGGEPNASFLAVSERDDFLVPVNYNRLQRALTEKYRFSLTQPDAALASIPGARYPGPACLGDARALAAFLMQQSVMQADGEEQHGWLVFDGGDLSQGGRISVSVDLGKGPRIVHFTIPAATPTP